MTRESLEKIKALVQTRQQELKESNNPKVFAQQRLIASGLVLENGTPNPVFDSPPYQELRVGFTYLRLPDQPSFVVSPPIEGGYIFTHIGENAEGEIMKQSTDLLTPNTGFKKSTRARLRQAVPHKKK